MINQILRTLLSVPLPLVSGCGAAHIGRAPTDADLVNDVSTSQQVALKKCYALKLHRDTLTRPGATPEQVEQELGNTMDVGGVWTPISSELAEDYVSTSEPAARAAETALIHADRLASEPLTYVRLHADGPAHRGSARVQRLSTHGPRLQQGPRRPHQEERLGARCRT